MNEFLPFGGFLSTVSINVILVVMIMVELRVIGGVLLRRRARLGTEQLGTSKLTRFSEGPSSSSAD